MTQAEIDQVSVSQIAAIRNQAALDMSSVHEAVLSPRGEISDSTDTFQG